MKSKVIWIVGGVVVFIILIAFLGNKSGSSGNSDSNQGPTPQASNADGNQTSTLRETAQQVIPIQKTASWPSDSNTHGVPGNPNGPIVQLKIAASVEFRSIALTSQENYTNCNNSLTVTTVDGNQQPMFIMYKDNHSAGLNLFAGDQHSIAYGSLTDNSGDTLAADIISGKYGNNTAGNWSLTCDQGQYGLTINSIK